jgi:hypothetical protein
MAGIVGGGGGGGGLFAGAFGAGNAYAPQYTGGDSLAATTGGGGGGGAIWGAGKKSSSKDLQQAIAALISGAAVPPTVNNEATNSTQVASTQGVTTNTNVGSATQQGTVTNVQQNMSSEALAALNSIISGGSNDPLIAAKDQSAARNIQYLQSLMSGIDPAQAEQRASGRVADLGRNLTEQILPELFGRTESAGFGTDALSSLLSQDAAVRTAEAQSRAVEEAYNAAVTSGIQASNTMGGLVEGTSAASQQLMEALGIAKGAVQTGVETRDLANSEASVGTQNVDTTATTNTSGTGTASETNPLGWANMLSGLLAQSMSADASATTGPSAREKALAAFMAAGGNPGELNRFGGSMSFGDYNQSNRDLWNGIAQQFGI